MASWLHFQQVHLEETETDGKSVQVRELEAIEGWRWDGTER